MFQAHNKYKHHYDHCHCVEAADYVTTPRLEPHGRETDAELGAHRHLGRGGVPQPVQVGHLKLGVGQRDRLVEQLAGALQVAALDLDCAESLVSKLTLLIDLQRLGDELHRLANVALGLKGHEAPVDQEVGVAWVHLHAGLVELVSFVKLLKWNFLAICNGRCVCILLPVGHA